MQALKSTLKDYIIEEVDPISGTTSGVPLIHKEDLDSESCYTHLYLSSVYHENIEKLKEVLSNEYYKLNESNNIDINIIKTRCKTQINDLEIEETEYTKINQSEKNKNNILYIFIHSLLILILTASVQLTFIISLIDEYINIPITQTNDVLLIIIRFLAFITLGIYLWVELAHGSIIFSHACIHGYMYHNIFKRLVIIIAGLIQCFTTLCCLYCSSQLIVLSSNVAEVIMNFTALVIIVYYIYNI